LSSFFHSLTNWRCKGTKCCSGLAAARAKYGAIFCRLLGKNFTKSILLQDESVLRLTLDLSLQESVSRHIHEALEKFQAKRIVAIVMEAETGAIRCLASAPTYDPNQYYRFPVEKFRTWATTDLFEPGSTFKPLNIAIALETDVIATTDRIQDPGRILIGGEEILNVGVDRKAPPSPPEYLTPAQILKCSSNVGMVQIIQRMPPPLYYDWLKCLGLGDEKGLTEDFPSVSLESVMKSKEEFCAYPIEPAVASFGQGLAMTPLKLLQLIASLANEGFLVTPHITEGLTYLTDDSLLPAYDLLASEGYELFQVPQYYKALYFGHVPIPSVQLGYRPVPRRPRLDPRFPRKRVFSPQTTRAVLKMLEEVVLDPQATGRRGFLPGYGIGGKTGTAQKASPQGGYREGAVMTSFVGVYPIHAPEFVTLVVIDEPQGPYGFASNTAADLTQRILAELVHVWDRPPDYPILTVSERTSEPGKSGKSGKSGKGGPS
jgi:cell division protein FtsI (penicillin-binding protein 3)